MATKIALATGVSRAWLLGQEGDKQTPLTALGLTYTRADYTSRAASRIRRSAERSQLPRLDLDGDIADVIDEACWEVTFLLCAAAHADVLPLAKSLLSRNISELGKQLRVRKYAFEARAELLSHVFGTAADPACRAYEENRERTTSNVRLISPFGFLKWAAAFAGRYPDRRRFLKELQALHDLVTESFSTGAIQTLRAVKSRLDTPHIVSADSGT